MMTWGGLIVKDLQLILNAAIRLVLCGFVHFLIFMPAL
jgi:hypothetical protein